jgi:aminopeptidase N
LNKFARHVVGWLLGLAVAAVQAAAPYHDIVAEIDPVGGEILLEDRVEVEGLREFGIALAPWLEIESVAIGGEPAILSDRDGLRVLDLPDTARHQLDFRLRGRVPQRDGSGSDAIASSGSDGLYLPGYADWVPHDYRFPMRYRLRIEVPVGQRAIATGKLVDEQRVKAAERAEFLQDVPGEAPSLFAGPYSVSERFDGDIRLRTYFHPGLEPLAETYLDTAGDYIRRFAGEIGDYPYADFHIVSAPLPVGLGFPNLTYIGREIVPLPFMRGRSLAHEVLHNWWGNGIGVDYAGGNWAEGLTTYLADYGLELDRGEDAAQEMRRKWLRDYAALPAERDSPLRAFRSKGHQASQVIGYNKAAFLFHMLELEIGADAFDAGLREFWQRHRFGVAGWGELRAAFERASGRELGWFFSQWLDRAGAPRVSLGAHRVERDGADYRISVEVLQPVSGYSFQLPVSLITENGSERYQIFVEEALTRLEWVTDARPLSIRFDPDNDVFRLLQADETPPILRDVTLDPRAATVVAAEDGNFEAAARELASRLFEAEPRMLELDRAAAESRPVLVFAESAGLPEALRRLNLAEPRLPPGPAASAAAWTARLADGRPILVISADDAEQLRTLLRPLPHYGSQSYVLFDAGRAFARGVWPVERGPLFREFEVLP